MKRDTKRNLPRTPSANGGQHPLTTRLVAAIDSGDPERVMAAVQEVDAKMKQGVPELWGVSEVARHLDIPTYQNVYKLRERGLPDPVIHLARGSLWDADTIRAYRLERKKRKARKTG